MSTLTFDDRGFGTEARRFPWSDLVAVGIRTTTEGAIVEDVFFQFLLRDGFVEFAGSKLCCVSSYLVGKRLRSTRKIRGANFRRR
ncbi:MAG: hypothetical protein NVS3B20_04350 [Polyangiales bacterium]